MASLRYEFDELNRLVIRDPLDAAQPRRVVEGRVTLDGRNRLHYRARTAPGVQGRPGDADVLLDGAWTLSPAHELGLLLHPSRSGEAQAVFLRGAIVGAKDDALIVSLAHRDREGRRTSQRVALSGRWQADDRNRLTFLVSRADGAEDRLVFEGAWEVDRARQLRYRYEQPQAGRRRAVHTLTFSGAWDPRPEMRLAYRLGADSRSALEFEAALQSPTLDARDGRLAYEVGIRLSAGRTVRRTVTLFGTWKLHRDLAISFELSHSAGGGRRLSFDGTATKRARHQLTIQALSREGKPMGFSVTFSRSFLKEDARWFLRLERSGDDARFLGGLTIKF